MKSRRPFDGPERIIHSEDGAARRGFVNDPG